MIKIETLTVSSFDLAKMTLSWEIEPTAESLSNYKLDIYRSEFDPEEDILDSMDLIASGISVLDYSYNDYDSEPLFYDVDRVLYYAISPKNTLTSKYGLTGGPTSMSVPQDFVAKRVIAQQALGLLHTGVLVYVIKARTFGQNCSVCYDESLGRSRTSKCTTCFDTGWVEGYYTDIQIRGVMNKNTNHQQQRDWGQWMQNDCVMIVGPYPKIMSGDFIVDPTNARWKVITVKPVTKSLYMTAQHCQLREILKDDIIYSVPV